MTEPTEHDPLARRRHRLRACTALAVALTVLCAGGAPARAEAPTNLLPLEDISPMFLAMYRKLLVIEPEIRKYSEKYGVDVDLTRAVCLYESGGNAGLNSGAGAQGYFQVMPRTFRTLGVRSNIEAGVKYLSQLLLRFDREDRAIAAYNGGPSRVGRNGGLPLETLQYVLGVGQYRMVLKQHDASLRYHAESIQLATVHAGEDWPALSSRLAVPEWELRVHNAFLAQRKPRPGQLIAHPVESRSDLFRTVGPSVEYRTRVGDNYLNLALTLGVDPDMMRRANSLWHLQSVPAGVPLHIPLGADRTFLLHAALGLTPEGAPAGWSIRPASRAPQTARIAAVTAKTPPSPPRATIYRVRRGDTLSELAGRYRTTISAIQRANRMGRRTTVRIGERLRMPR